MSSFDATYLAARISEIQPLGRAVSMPPLAGSSPRAELTRLTRLVESLVAETNALRSENARATRELKQAKSVLVDLAKYLKETGVLTNLDLLHKVDSLIDDKSSSASGSPSEEGMGPLAPLIEEASRQDSLPSTSYDDNSPPKQRPLSSRAAAGNLLTPRNAVKHIRDAALEDMHHSTSAAAAAGGAGGGANATHTSTTERACLPRAHSLHAIGSYKADITPRSMAKLVSLYPPPSPHHLEVTRSGSQEITRCASLGHLDWSFEGSALDPLLGTHDVASPLSSSPPAAIPMPRSPWSSASVLATSTVNTPHALPDLSLSGSPHKPPPPPPSSSQTPLSPPQTKTHTHSGVCRGKWLMSHMHRYTSTASPAHAPATTHTHTTTSAPPSPAAAAAHIHAHTHTHAHTQHTTHTRTPAPPQPPAAAYPVAPPASRPPPPPPPPTHTAVHLILDSVTCPGTTGTKPSTTPVSAHTPSTTTHTSATHTHSTKKHHDARAPVASTEEGRKDQPTPPQPAAAAHSDPCVRKAKPSVTNPLQSFTRRFSMIKPPPTTAKVEQEKEYLPRPFGLRRTSTCPPAIPSGLSVQVDGDGNGGGGDGV